MNQDRELPPYPPARNAWDYPPPPISRHWRWAPIIAVALVAIVGTGLIAASVVIMGKDFPGMIEDDRIVSVIDRECDIMTETVKSMPIKGSATEQAKTITEQNQAITNMLTEVRQLDGDVLRADPPTMTWLDDWDALIVAREAYAERLREGYDTDFRIPRDSHGDRIHERMDLVWLTTPVCEVPEELLEPYPADISTV